MLKKSLVLLLAAAMVVALTGCASKGPTIGGVLVQALADVNPGVFNTMLSSNAASSTIEGHIFEGIVRHDENMQIIGLLADKWDISQDNLELTFYLKKDVKWHDGVAFTAYDVQFTFGTMAFDEDYPGPKASGFSLLEEIQVIDDHTVKFTLSRPFAPFMNNLVHGIMPQHIFDPEYAQGANKVAIADMFSHPANREPIGTGPWTFSEWKQGEHIELTRNQNYHNSPEPYISTMLYKFIENANTAVALETGVIDMIAAIPDNEYNWALAKLGPEGADSHNFYDTQRLAYDYLGFNHRQDAFGDANVNPFNDIQVRQALAHGINRQGFIDTNLHGRGTIMNSSIPPISWAYAEEYLTLYEFDPQRAAELLDEAGWIRSLEDGYRYKIIDDEFRQKLEFTITLDKSDIRREMIAIFAQEEWKTLGIEVKLNRVDRSLLLSNYAIPGNYEMIVLGWSLGQGDPDCFYFHSRQNDAAYDNPFVDELLEWGRETVDIEARKDIYAELQAELSYDLPYIFLFTEMVTTVVSKKVKGVVSGALGLCYQERWYIKE